MRVHSGRLYARSAGSSRRAVAAVCLTDGSLHLSSCERLDNSTRVGESTYLQRSTHREHTASSLQRSLAALVDASSVSWPITELKEVCHTDCSKRIAASSEVVKTAAT